MATFAQKLSSLESLTGFDGLDYILFNARYGKVKIALVEYWIAVGAGDSTASNIKVYIIKDFGGAGETCKETTTVPKTTISRMAE